MDIRPPRALAAALVLTSLTFAACGEEDSPRSVPTPPASAQPEDFPSVQGMTLAELRSGRPGGPALAPSVSILRPGANRFAFALFDRAGKQMRGASVALYVASADGTRVRGPFPARSEDLGVKPQFAAKTTLADPDSARSVYVADVPFLRTPRARVIALARLDGRLVASSEAPVRIGARGPPEVGARAVRVHTPTEADARGNLSSIDTRVPPSSMHDVDLAEVLGKRPVVLVFATPQLCQSRVCGPIVDAVEQVKADMGDRAAFVHMEIYRNNRIQQGFRPQVAAWRLPTEPWVFAIDRSGRVAARLEGAASVAEVRRAAELAVRA